MDSAVYISETVAEHIRKPKVISGFMSSSSTEDIVPEFGSTFNTSNPLEDKREYLQEEREKLQESLSSRGNIKKKAVKSALMSVWEKIVSRSDILTSLQNIGRRIYERMIQKLLPFDFADEKTPIWSGEEKKRSLESKLLEHFEDKIKESMRMKIQDRMEQQIE